MFTHFRRISPRLHFVGAFRQKVCNENSCSENLILGDSIAFFAPVKKIARGPGTNGLTNDSYGISEHFAPFNLCTYKT